HVAAHVAPPRPAPRDPLRREPAPMTEDRLEVLANLAEIEKTARRVTLMDLTERVCKWPIGDPTDPEFRFCGLPSQPGKPYCAAHVAVAFQPMSSRRDRDRHRIRG
ncbi:MAG: GcrA family cell cycle regulator, partial [Rubrimonas sp.]